MKPFKYYMSDVSDGGWGDYMFYTTKREAEAANARFLKENKNNPKATAILKKVEVYPTKKDILRALSFYSTHPDAM